VKLLVTGTRQMKRIKRKVAQLVKDMKAGSVHTLIMSGVNPVYTLDSSFAEGLKSYYICFF
jgi:molybdopterin-containing oxidoreductase family iron-sulfur binding subunit